MDGASRLVIQNATSLLSSGGSGRGSGSDSAAPVLKGQAPSPLPSPVSMPDGKESLEQILKECEEYRSDGVTLYVRKPATKSELVHFETQVYMICPLCETLESYQSIGPHMNRKHNIPHIECAGFFCQGIFQTENYQKHIEASHFKVILSHLPGTSVSEAAFWFFFQVYCPICNVRFLIPDYKLHVGSTPTHNLQSLQLRPKVLQNAAGQVQPLEVSQKESELNVTPTPPALKSAGRPVTQNQLVLGPAHFTPKLAKNTEIVLDGAVMSVDGMEYAIKENIAFLDCPLCRKVVALAILGDHLQAEHELKRLACRASGCSEYVECHKTMEHLYSRHGYLECPECDYNLYIHEVRDHLESKCQRLFAATKRIPNQLNLNTVICGAPKLKPSVQEICPHCFEGFSDLKGHLLARHDPRVKCGVCGKRMGQSALQAHLNSEHGGNRFRRKQCPICRESYGKLKAHLVTDHDMSVQDAERVYAAEIQEETRKRLEIRLIKLEMKVDDFGRAEGDEYEDQEEGDYEMENTEEVEDGGGGGRTITLEEVDYSEDDPSTEEEFELKTRSDDDEDWNPRKKKK